MRYTGKSIYPKALAMSAQVEAKDNYMRAFVLSNELSRLEYEKKMASVKIQTLEKRIDDVRGEIQSINFLLGNTNGSIENEKESSYRKERHVTMEY